MSWMITDYVSEVEEKSAESHEFTKLLCGILILLSTTPPVFICLYGERKNAGESSYAQKYLVVPLSEFLESRVSESFARQCMDT